MDRVREGIQRFPSHFLDALIPANLRVALPLAHGWGAALVSRWPPAHLPGFSGTWNGELRQDDAGAAKPIAIPRWVARSGAASGDAAYRGGKTPREGTRPGV